MENKNQTNGKDHNTGSTGVTEMQTNREKLLIALKGLSLFEARAEIDALREWVLFNKPRYEAAMRTTKTIGEIIDEKVEETGVTEKQNTEDKEITKFKNEILIRVRRLDSFESLCDLSDWLDDHSQENN